MSLVGLSDLGRISIEFARPKRTQSTPPKRFQMLIKSISHSFVGRFAD